MRVEADRDLRGRDPAAERDQRGRVREREAGLLGDLADRRRAMGGVGAGARRGRAVGRVDRAAREDPGAAHEARLRVTPQQQDLECCVAAAQHDHGRRLARLDGRPVGELLAGRGSGVLHRRRY